MIVSRKILGSSCSLRQLTVDVIHRRSVAAAVAKDDAATAEWSNAKSFDSIPGPKPLPIPYVGNMWRFLPFGPFHNMDMLTLTQKLNKDYGPIVRLRGWGRLEFVFLYEPEDVETMFRNESVWPIRPGMDALDYYRTKIRKDVFGGHRGLVAGQGEDWHEFRSKVNQPMMQPRNTKMYVSPIDIVAGDFITRIRSIRDANHEMPKHFHNEINKWALESISLVALDTRLGCLDENLSPDSEAQKMITNVHILFDCIYNLDVLPSPWKLVSTPYWRKFVKTLDEINAIALKYINKKLQEIKERGNEQQESQSVLEAILSKEEKSHFAVTMALDMLAAGIDTTSNTMGTALSFLAANPDKQDKLFQEIVKVLPEKNTPVTAESLNELKYLKACLKESQRLQPLVAGNARLTVKDLVIGNYRIPKGTQLVSSHMVMCHTEKHYKDAKKYLPERWLKSDVPSDFSAKNASPFVYLPFGFGPRMCIGRRFAEMELEVLLAKIIRNFRVSYKHGEMVWESKLFNVPGKPLQFTMEDRNQ